MKQNKYSIFDSKAKIFNIPFYAANQAVALRMYSQAANSPDSMLGQYPEDYTLFELSVFDQETGREQEHPEPKNLGQPALYHARTAPENPEANQRSNFPVQVTHTSSQRNT